MKVNHLVFITLFCLSFATTAQNKFSVLPTVGVATPILDNGLGFQLGVNPSYAITPNFSLEGQVSFTHINATSFIAGEDKTTNSFYALIGGRLYLAPESKAFRPYINALIGGFNNNTSDGNLGFSTGGFLELNRTIIGLSFESSQNLVLKLGRVF